MAYMSYESKENDNISLTEKCKFPLQFPKLIMGITLSFFLISAVPHESLYISFSLISIDSQYLTKNGVQIMAK